MSQQAIHEAHLDALDKLRELGEHGHNPVAWAVAEIKRLQAEVDRLQQLNNDLHLHLGAFMADPASGPYAEVERLRGKIDWRDIGLAGLAGYVDELRAEIEQLKGGE